MKAAEERFFADQVLKLHTEFPYCQILVSLGLYNYYEVQWNLKVTDSVPRQLNMSQFRGELCSI